MDALAWLLGSSTRANVVRTLALSSTPLTAYRIARECNMNVAKVYEAARKMREVGLVEASDGERGVGYRLVQEDLRRLALKLSPRVVSLEQWKSGEARRFRFRAGLRTKPMPRPTRSTRKRLSRPERKPGELETLAKLGRKGFDSKYNR